MVNLFVSKGFITMRLSFCVKFVGVVEINSIISEKLYSMIDSTTQIIRELFKMSSIFMVLQNVCQYPGYHLLEALNVIAVFLQIMP